MEALPVNREIRKKTNSKISKKDENLFPTGNYPLNY